VIVHEVADSLHITAIREIRVACAPSWSAAKPMLTFYFIFDDRNEIPPDADDIVEALLARFKPTGLFTDFSFQVITLTELSAEVYVSSEPLDLEHLSLAGVE
jgi:hypothetical protein